jgi:hypothetical protein
MRLSPKIVAEVRALHAATTDLAQHGNAFVGRRSRRDAREARHAEADLLRILGFDSFDDFVEAVEDIPAVHERPAHRADSGPVRIVAQRNHEASLAAAALDWPVTNRDARIDELRLRVHECEEELAEARFEVRRQRDVLRELQSLQSDRAELIAIVAAASDEAQRIRDDATADAARIRDRARADAVALTRDALVTVDGLRRLAELEDSSVSRSPGRPET